MGEKLLDSGDVVFEAEGRLLQELGERLVASPEVALVELIKNAYDADATLCSVALEDNERTLVVKDDGHGMTLEAFKSRWMRIASSQKLNDRTSPTFGRRLTGQKGIGRFAVRFLGRMLDVDSVAWDSARGCKTRLTAEFNWAELDKQQSLSTGHVPYRLSRVDDEHPFGTRLIVKRLKANAEFAKSSGLRTNVLAIVNPISGLEEGRFRAKNAAKKKDPGFKVTLPGSEDDQEAVNLAKVVLSHAWARLTIDHDDNKVRFVVSFVEGGAQSKLSVPCKSSVSNGLFADIRFFPRRPGIFRGGEVDGTQAWKWVRNNRGVAVIDHGFRVKPYGFPDDDWLALDADSAHNRRDWRSPISAKHFDIPKEIRARPADNPALNLPSNFQLVGAVFVESKPASLSKDEDDLIPSMDREGFLNNKAFQDVQSIVRAGIEYLALKDKERLQEEAEKKAKEAAQKTRSDFRAAIAHIQELPTLSKSDKVRLVSHFSQLAKQVDQVEEYDREARRKLETMSALGAVAGFMTHEATTIVAALEETLDVLKKLIRKHPELKKQFDLMERNYKALSSQLAYARTFIDAVHEDKVASFDAASQVRRIIARFGDFSTERGITVECDIADRVMTPKIQVAVYSGILLNLYTNALKAILATKTAPTDPIIIFRAANKNGWHVLEVLDNGVGIPPELRSRIWDPLFTTTSSKNNPLGSGMGLGLTLVKQLVTQLRGKVELVDAPSGLSTCLRVQLPLE